MASTGQAVWVLGSTVAAVVDANVGSVILCEQQEPSQAGGSKVQ